MSLNLREMPNPADPGDRVRIFGTVESAVEHIRKHVLTEPDCLAWPLVDPETSGELGLDDGRRRARMLQQSKRPDADMQSIYDFYADVISSESKQAAELGWVFADSEQCLCLGTSGLLTVIQKNVVTAFFADMQEYNELEKEQRLSSGFRLNRRPMRRSKTATQSKIRESRRRRAQLKNRTLDEQIYHNLFRKTVKFVRSFQPHPLKEERGRKGQYWKLQCRLPRLSRLKFRDWIELRRRSRSYVKKKEKKNENE